MRMKISPARSAAYEILLRVEQQRSYTAALLPKFESGLNERDSSLCHKIVLGVLRKKLYLDAAVEKLTVGRKLDIEIRIILWIGLFQILELDRIPEHSIVNECVELVKKARKTSATGFVNAILRRALKKNVIIEFEDQVDEISVKTSHPRWLIERWITNFGIERAEAIAMANGEDRRRAYRVSRRGIKDGYLVGSDTARSENVADCWFAEGGERELQDAAERGYIYFQDEASQLVAAAVEIPKEGLFLDACAAPGSKTTYIADKHCGSGAKIFAGDRHLHRARFLKINAEKQGLSEVMVFQYDAANGILFERPIFDTILIDAPCSGTGTLGSNPELRYFLTPEDLNELHSKQLKILTKTSKYLKPGGRLYYSTCSMEPEENEMVMMDFLGSQPDFEVEKANVPERFATDSGFYRTFPDRDAMDGFFLALLRRN